MKKEAFQIKEKHTAQLAIIARSAAYCEELFHGERGDSAWSNITQGHYFGLESRYE